MATFTSIVSSPAFKPRLFLTCSFRTTHLRNRDRMSSSNPSRKLVTAQLRVPGDDKSRFDMIKVKKLWQSVVPDSAKEFEWKKAGEVLQDQLFLTVRKALILLFVACFGFSCISDAIYSISMNKELLIPLGLFTGCLFADFVKETSLEFFRHSEAMALDRHLVGIGCFCVLLKLMSLLLPVQGRVFFLNVANGGLLQVLWLWRSSLIENLIAE